MEYFELRRTGDQRLTADITFGDEVFSLGTDVSSYFHTEVLRLSYAYSIVRSGHTPLLASLPGRDCLHSAIRMEFAPAIEKCRRRAANLPAGLRLVEP